MGRKDSSKPSYDQPTPYGTWNSRTEGFKRVMDPRKGGLYGMENESTMPIKDEAHELNGITVTTNIDIDGIKRVESSENTDHTTTWRDDERDTVPFAGTAK